MGPLLLLYSFVNIVSLLSYLLWATLYLFFLSYLLWATLYLFLTLGNTVSLFPTLGNIVSLSYFEQHCISFFFVLWATLYLSFFPTYFGQHCISLFFIYFLSFVSFLFSSASLIVLSLISLPSLYLCLCYIYHPHSDF